MSALCFLCLLVAKKTNRNYGVNSDVRIAPLRLGSTAEIFKHFPTALIDPDSLLVCIVVGGDYLHLVSVERACRNRDALRSDHLQLFDLRLLFLSSRNFENSNCNHPRGEAKRSLQTCRRHRQTKRRPDRRRSVSTCPFIVRRAAQFVRRHVHLDRHWTLLDPATLQQQTSFFDRADVDDLALRSLSSFIDGPRSIFFLDVGLQGERNFLSPNSDRRLVVVSTGPQIDRGFRKLGSCASSSSASSPSLRRR